MTNKPKTVEEKLRNLLALGYPNSPNLREAILGELMDDITSHVTAAVEADRARIVKGLKELEKENRYKDKSYSHATSDAIEKTIEV